MPGSPFDLDEGFENIPIVKGSGQAINKVATTGVKYTKQQAAAIAKSFVSQLYGASTQTSDDDQQQNANVNTAARAQKAQVTSGRAQIPKTLAGAHIQQHAVQSTSQQTAQTPEEQAQISEARKQLFQQSTEYYDQQFGNIADEEANIQKEAQVRKQRDEEREQEEEQKKQQLAQIEEQKKKELPDAVKKLRNKAESNRGVSG